MAYLHEGCRDRILHFDLGSQLDSNFLPKAADFGLSKFMNKNQSIMMTNTFKATFSFLQNECVQGVFSYGMVVLEILSWQDENGYEESHLQDMIVILQEFLSAAGIVYLPFLLQSLSSNL